MSDRLKFIEDASKVERECRAYIDQLRRRAPIILAIHRELVRYEQARTKPTVRWASALQQVIHMASETPAKLSGFSVDKPSAHMRGNVTFSLKIADDDPVRVYVYYLSAGHIDANSCLMGFASDLQIADALEKRLPYIAAQVNRYNAALQELCDISTTALDQSLPIPAQVLYPLSNHFQWYELAGDVGKAGELRRRGITVR